MHADRLPWAKDVPLSERSMHRSRLQCIGCFSCQIDDCSNETSKLVLRIRETMTIKRFEWGRSCSGRFASIAFSFCDIPQLPNTASHPRQTAWGSAAFIVASTRKGDLVGENGSCVSCIIVSVMAICIYLSLSFSIRPFLVFPAPWLRSSLGPGNKGAILPSESAEQGARRSLLRTKPSAFLIIRSHFRSSNQRSEFFLGIGLCRSATEQRSLWSRRGLQIADLLAYRGT